MTATAHGDCAREGGSFQSVVTFASIGSTGSSPARLGRRGRTRDAISVTPPPPDVPPGGPPGIAGSLNVVRSSVACEGSLGVHTVCGARACLGAPSRGAGDGGDGDGDGGSIAVSVPSLLPSDLEPTGGAEGEGPTAPGSPVASGLFGDRVASESISRGSSSAILCGCGGSVAGELGRASRASSCFSATGALPSPADLDPGEESMKTIGIDRTTAAQSRTGTGSASTRRRTSRSACAGEARAALNRSARRSPRSARHPAQSGSATRRGAAQAVVWRELRPHLGQ